MIDDAALRRAEQAEARLERARRRLRDAQAAAFLGTGALGALDAAILAHRWAEAKSAAAPRSSSGPAAPAGPAWPRHGRPTSRRRACASPAGWSRPAG